MFGPTSVIRAYKHSQIRTRDSQFDFTLLACSLVPLARSPPLTPSHSDDLGDGFLFLSARERTPRTHHGEIGDTLREYFIQEEAIFGNVPPAQWLGPKIRRWARLKLPNGQVARSAWKEQNKPPEKVRQARCVKVDFFFYSLDKADNRVLASRGWRLSFRREA